MSQSIKIKLKSFDQKLLDQSCRHLVSVVKLIGASILMSVMKVKKASQVNGSKLSS